MENVFDTLQARGFIQQVTHPEDIKTRLQQEPVTFYIGFDPTASSFHIGNLLPIMAMVHMQRAGHRPIAILGAGTAMVGDPSGKTEMRQMLTRDTIEENALALRGQLERYLSFEGDNGAMLISNGDWLFDLRYIDFLRDIGRHFSVNRMLTFEAYKQRMETGLSFLEFNYQLLQAYDFLILRQRYNCILQMGGDDQWGNIVAGADLIRRVEQTDAYAITFPLLATASGQKMGKTADGAVWLDAERTTPYEFYQYWINVDDRDVKRFLRFYTLLPLKELARFDAMEGAELREAKRRLAFEATVLTHGDTAAHTAEQAAQAMFGGDGEAAEMPETLVTQDRFDTGMLAVDLLVETELAASKGAARRLIQQGGASLNGTRLETVDATVTSTDVQDGAVILRAGKKRYHRVVIE
ncbi:MAG: tyrosyl-tRNA synthetase [Candidatus Entotheonella factor]|uniref:Tyrosine--tRNA ligase n=1 Tax=Entotheonella factor TaxID=1429438 RepID=W4L9X9_ENTF1|nr:tyrosine--tRNA ligase [Candidatus Entotheonella palauensis]ETW94797.1 MAG: tyrosyl-tRNA synthetase [Candidatus Entotheonella factor]